MTTELNLSSVKIGDSVKLNINNEEKLWIEITEIADNVFKGKIDEYPIKSEKVSFGDVVSFDRENIIDFLEN